MNKQACFLTLSLMFGLSCPVSAQEAWRAHVTALTAKVLPPLFLTHSHRNYLWAKKLAAADHVTLDDDVIFAAAYLHDMGNFAPYIDGDKEHGAVAAAKLDEMLAGSDFPKAKMDRVRDAMRNHMFNLEPADSAEARYLHDADAVDNVGTIGLAWVMIGVDSNGGKPTPQMALNTLTKFAPKIEERAVTPAGKAEMAIRAAERKAFMEQLARETDNFKEF